MNSTTRKNLVNTLYFCLGIILLGFILEIVCLLIGNKGIFPDVWTIIKSAFELLGKKSTYISVLTTTRHLILSLLFSLAIGGILGTLSSRFSKLYFIFKPTMSLFRTLPMIVLILVLMIVVGFDNSAVYATTIVLIPVFYEAFYQGISNIDKSYLDVYKLESKLTPRVLMKVHFPLIGAHIITALTNSIGMGIKVLVTTEYIAGVKNSLGEAVHTSWSSFEYSYILGYSLIMILLVVVFELLPKFFVSVYKFIKYY